MIFLLLAAAQDPPEGAVLRFVASQEELLDVAWSPDGKRLASAGRDRAIQLWDAAKGGKLRTIGGHAAAVVSARFSPDGARILSAGTDAVRLWDASTGRELLKLEPAATEIYRCPAVWSPDGKSVAWSRGYTVYVADAESGKELVKVDTKTFNVTCVAWHPDGRRFATGDGYANVHVWNFPDGSAAWQPEMLLGSQVSFSADGKSLLTCGMSREAALWDVGSWECRRTFGGGDLLKAAFSPDGKKLATTHREGAVRFWDLEGRESGRARSHAPEASALAWSPDGKALATAGKAGTVVVWEIK